MIGVGASIEESLVARTVTLTAPLLAWPGRSLALVGVGASETGGRLLEHTGTKKFTASLRTLAASQGYRLTAAGLRRGAGPYLPASSSESAIFATLGLPFVPPNFRHKSVSSAVAKTLAARRSSR